MFSNCWFFAHALKRRRLRTLAKRGDTRRIYIVERKSDAGNFSHFLYIEELPHSGLRRISFKPIHPVPRIFPPPLFRGSVRWGDKLTTKEDHG